MKYAVIVLSAAALAACDSLSVAGKKPVTESVKVAPQPIRQGTAPQNEAQVKANDTLAARVKQALEKEEKALAANVDVIADSGAVTLWGTASAEQEIARIGKLALGVEGVKSVDNKIVVVKGS